MQHCKGNIKATPPFQMSCSTNVHSQTCKRLNDRLDTKRTPVKSPSVFIEGPGRIPSLGSDQSFFVSPNLAIKTVY